MLSTVINSPTSSPCYTIVTMDSLIKAADNVQCTTSVEKIKQDLFCRVYEQDICTIWDYYGVSREQYLALFDTEKRERISKYYFDMKSRSASGKIPFFFLF